MSLSSYSARGKYIGLCHLGDNFSFTFDPRNDVQHTAEGAAAAPTPGWAEDVTTIDQMLAEERIKYRVVNNESQTIILDDQSFKDPLTDFEGILFGSFNTNDTDWDVGCYTLRIYLVDTVLGTDDDDETKSVSYMFNILPPSPEQSSSLTYRRLLWIRNDIENVVFPRLKRLLGFEGENLLLDLFTYDNAGNITSMRARIFDTQANCVNATPDLDPTDTPEPGELWTYTITQAHNLPRNTRTEHRSVIDFNGPLNNLQEMQATDNFKETDVVDSPRNTGRETTWPDIGLGSYDPFP